ncbi:MAG TPA: DUF885 domain-containing protein [Candidatus Polarisedimenticolia bacterium]|nr:DUF885 domain-containing protein [Candidatus Polarisedimenticolia bacterium]
MNRQRPGVRRMDACLAASVLLLTLCAACRAKPQISDFQKLRHEYFIGFLKNNPETCTYLGADGADKELAACSRNLKDYTELGRRDEMAFYKKIQDGLKQVDTKVLSADDEIDYQVMQAQLRFLLHQTLERRYYQRALDTYTTGPFRAVDWQIQQMTDLGNGNYGTQAEWGALSQRLERVPDYLDAAIQNLREGVSAGNRPDRRMVSLDGIKAAKSNAEYFRNRLLDQARAYLSQQPYRDSTLNDLTPLALAAGDAYGDFAETLGQIFLKSPDDAKETFREDYLPDTFALGQVEYDWALRNNLKIDRKAEELFGYGDQKVRDTQDLMVATARAVAEKLGLKLEWGDAAKAHASVRHVMDALSEDYPKSDAEMFTAYRAKAMELVAYGRSKGMFDLPADYKLEIVETPAVLVDSVDAAYYPAPPFKTTGIGRFFLTPTGGDVGRLKENNLHAMADLCAHEGFPGHDWYYQFLNSRRDAISPIRWLTPGAVEDSSSMWEDSPAAEGWGLYAEALMAEPQKDAPEGFYTPEEKLYAYQGQLLRDARVHLDTGLHTRKLTFDQAIDYYTENVDFLPGACRAPESDDIRRASCATARRAIYRYSKWPTQAVTYHLGKLAIQELRDEARKRLGDRYDDKRFHELVLSQGTVPPGYFKERVLSQAAGK